MATTDANPPLPEFRSDYLLMEVDADYMARAVKPKQFIHIDQSECIACEGCVDICPWKCIHMQTVDAVAEAYGCVKPGDDPADAFIFTIDDDVCTGDRACIRLSGCPSLTIKDSPDPLRSEPVTTINSGCVGCGLCGENAHAAVLCPSFYRAEVVQNPGFFDTAFEKIRGLFR